MIIKTEHNPFLVFDLDDTLYPEYSFLISGYRQIALFLERYVSENIFDRMLSIYQTGGNVFQWISEKYAYLNPEEISIQHLLTIYRLHMPDITMYEDAKRFLELIRQNGLSAGLITDGRSKTQRNKLYALGLSDYFDEVVISEEFGTEKPDERNYAHFEKKYPDRVFYYFGDNIKKDFISPIKRGWTPVCMENRGQNIHSQTLSNLPEEIKILKKFSEILVS